MFSKIEYFVLTLYINAVASNPYFVPKKSGHEDYNSETLDLRNEEVYLLQDEPSYMSPTPTKKDYFRDSRNLRDPSKIENHRFVTNDKNEKSINDDKTGNIPDFNYRQDSIRTKLPEQVNRIPNIATDTSSYSNPSSAVDGNDLTKLTLRKNKPIVNNIILSSGPVNNREPKRGNTGLEVLGHYEINNNQPLRIQARPEKRIVFQEAPNLTNLEAYRPATPVNDFNLDREWSKISSERGTLPESIAKRLKYPVDFQNIRQQKHGSSNRKFLENNIQKVITDPRIQNVIASTNQTKRYMVIHPDGTVEHVDTLKSIYAQHPDFLLVNSGQIFNNAKTKVIRDQNNLQDQPSLSLIASQKESVSLDSKSSEPTEKQEVVIDVSSKNGTAVNNSTSTTPESFVVSSSATIAKKISPSILDSKTVLENVETSKNNETDTTEKLTHVKIEDISGTEGCDINTANSAITTAPTDVTTTTETKEIASLVEPTSKAEVTIISGDASVVTSENETNERENVVNNDSNSKVQSLRNYENTEVAQVSEARSGKPVIFDTSDPDFWQKVTDGRDNDNIIFFLVKSSPRVERDTVRTVFPDGSVLEELTETVWEEEGAEPKITKSSKIIIHPDDL